MLFRHIQNTFAYNLDIKLHRYTAAPDFSSRITILNLNAPDPEADGIDFVAKQARQLDAEYAISNGFGFGGVNASAIFKRWT